SLYASTTAVPDLTRFLAAPTRLRCASAQSGAQARAVGFVWQQWPAVERPPATGGHPWRLRVGVRGIGEHAPQGCTGDGHAPHVGPAADEWCGQAWSTPPDAAVSRERVRTS